MEKKLTFEEALAELEGIVQKLEDGQIGLTESLARYEEGVRFLKQCHEALRESEQKISLLTSIDEEGEAKLEPFDDEAMSLDEKQTSRSRRRSHKPPEASPEDDIDTQPGLF